MDLSKKQTDALHDQIKHNFHLAWFNLLREKTLQNPPDFDWIVNLYKELRHRLTCFLKKDSNVRKRVEEDLDVELFDQMIRNGAFQGPEFLALVNYIFKTCLRFGSPGRDKDVQQLKQEIINALNNKAIFAELVPLFFKNANIAIDWIHKDLQEVRQNLEKLNHNTSQ